MSNVPHHLKRKGGNNARAGLKVVNFHQVETAAEVNMPIICTDFDASRQSWPGFAGAAHLQFAITYGRHRTLEILMAETEAAMKSGAHSVYCISRPQVVEALARREIPVFCHVGLVPQVCTGAGGLCIVGKTETEAGHIRQAVADFTNAGAVGVYIHLVPENLAAEITATSPLVTISVGAGGMCDVTWAHADDILGITAGHIPRHARVYAGRSATGDKACFSQYLSDVEAGKYPGAKPIFR